MQLAGWLSQWKLSIIKIAIRAVGLTVDKWWLVKGGLRSISDRRQSERTFHTKSPLLFCSACNTRHSNLPPYLFPLLPCLSLHDMSKWSCGDVSPHALLIGAQRSNQGRTNQTVLVISCDQCSLGNWEMCAYFCNTTVAAWWHEQVSGFSGDREIGTGYKRPLWSHSSLLPRTYK